MDGFLGLRTIFGADGEHETPYLTQAWIGRLRLHVFHRGDADPDCHDHPWDFWTFPLTAYVEEVALPDRFSAAGAFVRHRQVVHAFRLHFRPAEHTHRVLGRYAGLDRRTLWPHAGERCELGEGEPIAQDGRVVTIVWRGRARRKWGFLKNREGLWCWVPWKDYVLRGGKHAPCEPGGGDA